MSSYLVTVKTWDLAERPMSVAITSQVINTHMPMLPDNLQREISRQMPPGYEVLVMTLPDLRVSK